ncbi:sensor histidine kinase [Streptomyces sp. NPDC050842]|uniref:sensor histidine kinase n=1 Tax=Streptomyces sp. NPDC050842 TaxID=3365636 RepID=UPI00379AE3BC
MSATAAATTTAAPPPAASSAGRVSAVLAWCVAAAHPFVLFFGVQAGPFRSTELRLFLTTVGIGMLLPLARRRPEAALGLLLVGLFAAATTWPAPELLYLPVLAADACVGWLTARRPLRIAVPAALTTLAVQLGAATYTTSGRNVFVTTALALALALLTAGLLGRSVRERRAHATELRARSEAEAVTAERLRIARELHDVVAHSIGVIAIQAGVGRRVIDTQPAEARNALATIETTSRETLAGLRRTLGALRASTKDTPAPGRTPAHPSSPAPAPLEPAPGLADLDRLVASTADAGVRVEVRRLGAPGLPLPPEVDLAAYRIVQESLTNVVRHASTAACRVTVDRSEDTLLVEITDDGPSKNTALDTGAYTGAGTEHGHRHGYGIVGMRERAALLGGRFSAGPRPGGGFHVTAALPLPLPQEGPRTP